MEFKYYNVKEIQNLLDENDINCRRKFGQNFLINPGIAGKIVESLDISENDLVVEIGCGVGSLTNKILDKGCRVIGFEIDRAFVRILNDMFPAERFKLIEGDFLKEADGIFKNFRKKDFRQIKVAGNLPYYITKPIIEKIFTSDTEFDSVCIMIQKEAAVKILSMENGKKYSYISVISQVNKEISSVCDVRPSSFFPQPEVDSEVLLFKPVNAPDAIRDKNLFFRLAKSLFMNRRKKLMNNLNLSPFLNQKEKELLRKLLYNLNISDNLRGENIPVKDIIRISNELCGLLNP